MPLLSWGLNIEWEEGRTFPESGMASAKAQRCGNASFIWGLEMSSVLQPENKKR